MTETAATGSQRRCAHRRQQNSRRRRCRQHPPAQRQLHPPLTPAAARFCGLIDTPRPPHDGSGQHRKDDERPFSMKFYKSAQYMRRTPTRASPVVHRTQAARPRRQTGGQQALPVRVCNQHHRPRHYGGHADGWLPSGERRPLPPTGQPVRHLRRRRRSPQKVREVLRAGAKSSSAPQAASSAPPTTRNYPVLARRTRRHRPGSQLSPGNQSHITRAGRGRHQKRRPWASTIDTASNSTTRRLTACCERHVPVVPTSPHRRRQKLPRRQNLPYAVRKARETIEIHRDSIAKAYASGVRLAMVR